MPDIRLIDANVAKEKLGFAIEPLVGSDADIIRNDALLDAIKIVDSMQTVNAQPVKRGKWITTQKTIDDGITHCSYCNREFYIEDLAHVGNAAGFCEFCPACGSDNRCDADGVKELIENGKVNGRHNYCMICGQHISTYKQICHECEVKYNINWGDSITQKMQEYIQNTERGGKRMTLDELISYLDYVVNKSPLATLNLGSEDKQLLHWLEDYKQLKEATRLIPRSERMPDKDGYYLCVINGEFKILRYGNGEFYCKWDDGVLSCCNSSVTHWMQLPEKPIGE